MPAPDVALVHDWFIQDGGAETCAIELAAMLADAPVYTSFYDESRFGRRLPPSRVRPWPLQGIVRPGEGFRRLLPLYLAWFSALRPQARRLVLSSCVAFTNNVHVPASALHVSYVYTPPRFAWNLDGYLRGSSFSVLSRVGARAARPVLRRFDRAAGRRPDVVIAISETVRDRIRRAWGRDSEVIYPPVDTAAFPLSREDDGYLLVAARLLAYRRIDVAVEAAKRMGRELVIAGSGPEMTRLRALAGPQTRFVGYVNRPELIRLVQRCHAYLVPGIEDFGIAPVEAMASGKPVIALAAGGALETVTDGRTGLLVRQPTVTAFSEAIEGLDHVAWDPDAIRAGALSFDREVFRTRWTSLLDRLGLADLVSPEVATGRVGVAPASHAATLPASGPAFRGSLREAPVRVRRSSPGSRILVIGINYWPEISGIAPYTTALAEHLSRVGHEVRVLTGMPHYPSWAVFPGYRRELRRTEERGGVEIVRRAHYVPPRQSAVRRGLYEASFLVSGLSAALSGGYDVVLGVVPSLSGALLARVASARCRVSYGLLFQDLMGPAAQQSGIPGGGGAVAAATAKVEGWAARGAARVAVVSPTFIPYLRHAGVSADRIVVLPNWSRVRAPSGDRIRTRERLGWGPDDQIALHTGNMGLKQGLEQVIDAGRLATREAPRVRFVLVGDGSQRESLERSAGEVPNVAFLPFQPEEDFPDLLAAADVLLLSERPSVADMSLPSKLTSYLMSGRPVVAAVASDGASAGLIRASGAGVIVAAGRPEGILSAIGDLLAHPSEAAALGRAGRAYADSELSAERSLGAIEEFVLELVDGSRRGQQWTET